MSEGRLAPVRETDRHAGLIAGIWAAGISAVTFTLLHMLNVDTSLGGPANHSVVTSFWFLTIICTVLGLVIGFAEGAIASRVAHRAADRYQPLPELARRIFAATAVVNVVLVAIAVSISFSGSSFAIALLTSVVVAIASSAAGSALFAWSHALDWPHVPYYLRTPALPNRPRPQVDEGEKIVDIEAGRNEVVKEGRGRRDSSVDDDVWQDIQDLISGR